MVFGNENPSGFRDLQFSIVCTLPVYGTLKLSSSQSTILSFTKINVPDLDMLNFGLSAKEPTKRCALLMTLR
jgi:hypothetical protein